MQLLFRKNYKIYLSSVICCDVHKIGESAEKDNVLHIIMHVVVVVAAYREF